MKMACRPTPCRPKSACSRIAWLVDQAVCKSLTRDPHSAATDWDFHGEGAKSDLPGSQEPISTEDDYSFCAPHEGRINAWSDLGNARLGRRGWEFR
jgi:hypothetical protein